MKADMKFTEDTITKYIDDELSIDEKVLFDKELKIDTAFAELFDHHRTIHVTLAKEQLQSPAANFVDEVMSSVRVSNITETKFFNKMRLLILSLIAVAVATSLYYLSMKFYPTLGLNISNEISLKDVTLNLQPAQKLINSDILFKVVFYVNGLISLLLLDRAILKPYFARRKQRYSIQTS